MVALKSLLAPLALLATTASAANICAYSSRGCGGNYVCCNSIAAGRCCYWSNGAYGWGVGYASMAYYYWGGVYTDTQCGVEAGGVEASAGTTKCKLRPTLFDYLSTRFAKGIMLM